jgi:lipopolysaccharide heptosyltransferase I
LALARRPHRALEEDPLKRSASDASSPHVLLIRLSAIGDVVRTLPALTCLRRAWPNARITWAVEEASREILQDQPDLDDLLVFPRRKLARVLLHPGEADEARDALAAFIGSLKDARFDLVIDFQGTIKSGVIAKLTGAKRRVGLGRGHAREMSHLFYNDRVVPPSRKMSRVDRALAIVRHLGVSVEGATARIPERTDDAAYVDLFLASLPQPADAAGVAGPAGRVPPAVVFPGTSRGQSYKRYPPENFARAADLLSERTGSHVVVAWGPGEEELAGEVIAAMRAPATLAPSLTLGQLTELIRRSRVFVAGDTGPMHIAWTIGTPVVAVLGPTDPELNRPGGEFSAVAYEKVFCSPCRNRGCIARTCLEHLSPDTVAREAMSVMEKAEAKGVARRPMDPGSRERPRASGRSSGLYETMGPGSSPRD